MYTKEQSIEIAKIVIPKDTAGVVIFGTLCALNFKVLYLLQRIALALRLLAPRLDVPRLKIRLHPWIFNPFAETDQGLGLLTDNAGYSLLLLQWWFGFHTGWYLALHEPTTKSLFLQASTFTLAAIYLALGLLTMLVISDLMTTICQRQRSITVKLAITLLAIPIGAFGIRYLFW